MKDLFAPRYRAIIASAVRGSGCVAVLALMMGGSKMVAATLFISVWVSVFGIITFLNKKTH